MSLKNKIFEFILNNPGVRLKEIRDAFPDSKENAINSAVRRLGEKHLIAHAQADRFFKYFVPAHAAPKEVTFSEFFESEVSPEEIADLESMAEKLESKGLFNRAATTWLKAFDACRINKDRDLYLKRRKRCLDKARRPASSEGRCLLAGRFSPEGI